MEIITQVNNSINGFVWGMFGLVLLIGTGILLGAVMTSSLAWDISDTFNGLMMFPNLIGVVALSPLVVKITKNYVARIIKNKDVAPILSYDEALNAEAVEEK